MRKRWDRRYRLVPQLRDYDRVMTPEWVPYLMLRNRRRIQSGSCNTDEHGFRLTHAVERVLDYRAFESSAPPKGVVIGGSLAFGVGVSRDAKTIPSLLNTYRGMTWFNFGVRMFNSTQEVLLFLLFQPDVEEVVLLSGLNNLVTHPFSTYFVPRLGSFCEDYRFRHVMEFGVGVLAEMRSVWKALERRAGRTWQRSLRPAAEPDGTHGRSDKYRALLEIIERDLDLWCMVRESRRCRVSYFLQPCALWVDKVPTPEESELFTLLDAQGGQSWGMLMRYLREVYPTYRQDLRALCAQRGILFDDLNESVPKHGWLFCDRAHLTDEGSAFVAEFIAERLGVAYHV